MSFILPSRQVQVTECLSKSSSTVVSPNSSCSAFLISLSVSCVFSPSQNGAQKSATLMSGASGIFLQKCSVPLTEAQAQRQIQMYQYHTYRTYTGRSPVE